MNSERPAAMNSERPATLSPERPAALNPERPATLNLERSATLNPERPATLNPERPATLNPERPESVPNPAQPGAASIAKLQVMRVIRFKSNRHTSLQFFPKTPTFPRQNPHPPVAGALLFLADLVHGWARWKWLKC